MAGVVCIHFPGFALAVAAGGRTRLLGVPAALAPAPGGPERVGEVSRPAAVFGLHAGMRLGEALSRCPSLELVPPDPAGVEAAWDALLRRLEGIGAAVEHDLGPPALAAFPVAGLRRLHGGTLDGVLAAVRRALGQRAAGARIGAAPSRFCAYAAATRARARRPEVVPGQAGQARAYLAPLPVALLRARAATAHLPEPLARLGIGTLGELAALPRAALADRFGAAGVLARDLARGHDEAPRPREPAERLEEGLELPEAVSGPQLERALALLVDRLLARPERGGRTIRAATLSATLVEGGTWRERVAFREASADPVRMRLALAGRLRTLPAPAETLHLAAEGLGPPPADQRPLLGRDAAERRVRLREAIRQARAAAGPDAALRVLLVDPDSRVPERRAVLTPFEDVPERDGAARGPRGRAAGEGPRP